MPITHQLLALFVTLIWGTNFVFIDVGLEQVPPFIFASLRFALMALPLVFFLPRPKVPWRYLVAYGILIGFGQFGLLFWVMQSHMSPGLASLVIQIQVEHIPSTTIHTFHSDAVRHQLAGGCSCGRVTIRLAAASLPVGSSISCSHNLLQNVGMSRFKPWKPSHFLTWPDVVASKIWNILRCAAHHRLLVVPDFPIHAKQQPLSDT